MVPYKRVLVTSALPYANGPLHIGHLAGAYLPADIYVRFLRLMGKEVAFICGSDEHGAAITMRAKKENVSPQEIIDRYHNLFVSTFREMGISFDYYDRTSASHHHQTAQEFFRRLYEKGIFNERESLQYYDEEAGQFLADRYIKGSCPNCKYPEAYGDQCESCGSTLSPSDLINPVSTLTDTKPIKKETRHWYLPLQKEEKWLREWLLKGEMDGQPVHDPQSWKPHVLGQCRSWLDQGLHERAMTRDLDWGVDVPTDIQGAEGKKLYVWMDAPIGYISATKKWAEKTKNNWQDYWQSEETKLVHFIGKDNIVFHCIIFPSLLKEHGGYILPENVPANQFMNLEGRKISTSRNWAIWVHEFVAELPEHKDAMRYALTQIMPEHRDSEFTWQAFMDMNNNELVNSLANFIHRVLVLTHKYYDGIIPAFDPDQEIASARDADEISFHDSEMLDLFDHLHELCTALRSMSFRNALRKLMEIAAHGNQLLQFNEPWKKIKDEPESVKVVLHVGLQVVAAISVAMEPFMPFAADRLRGMLRLPKLEGQGELVALLDQLAEGETILSAGHKIDKASHLFQRIPEELIEQQRNKLGKEEEEEEKVSIPGLKEEANFADFATLDLRTGKIISAKPIPKTDKLLQIELDIGLEKRTVVSGIAEHFKPADLVGQQVILIANLPPKKIRGVLSEGMILMAEDQDGKFYFAQAPNPTPPGSIVK